VKKDIEIPVVKDVYLAIVHEWNDEFLSKDWNAYVINDKKVKLEMVLVVSKGFDGDRKTSTMRHAIGIVEPNPHYSRIFYSKAKLPAVIENARNLFSSKLGYSSFAKKLLRFQILPAFAGRQVGILTFHNENP